MNEKDTRNESAVEFEAVEEHREAFGEEQVKAALDELRKYVSGKASIDAKATENQMWWRLRHLDISPEAKENGKKERSVSAWAVNSILNKHADIMDSFPKTWRCDYQQCGCA